MIGIENILKQFTELPLKAQQEAADFISFLYQRYALQQSSEVPKPSPLSEEPFVGMWKNRKELDNSTKWVRSVRQNEWRG
ncbi:MAG: DUF2281 domain-containing protein [Proteobacteria bacterium]|nr:DUF2281 domain-containing protein [Pseudomonadota bacterium]